MKNSTNTPKTSRYTHGLQYQQKDGSWIDGRLAYTLDEAKDVAREGRKRTGRKVRIVALKSF